MKLHVATDPFQPIARRRAVISIAVFVLVIATGPALWFAGIRVQTRATPPAPHFDRVEFLDGELTAKLDRYLVESSPVTSTIRGVFGDLWMCFGLLETKGVVFGRGGFLFLRSTLGEPHRFGLDRETRRAALAALRAEAESLGVRVLVVPVPDKARVYGDLLEPADRRGAARDAMYGAVLDELRATGFEVVDLDAAMRAWRRARPEEPLFQRLDTHWTLEACWRTAELCAARLDELAWIDGIPRAELRAQPIQSREGSGDLVAQTGLPQRGVFRRLLQEDLRWMTLLVRRPDGTEGPPRAIEPGADIALAGDSFADAGLFTALSGHLGLVLDAGGVKPARGPREGIVETLSRIRRGELRAKVVVWEAVERSFDEGWWGR